LESGEDFYSDTDTRFTVKNLESTPQNGPRPQKVNGGPKL